MLSRAVARELKQYVNALRKDGLPPARPRRAKGWMPSTTQEDALCKRVWGDVRQGGQQQAGDDLVVPPTATPKHRGVFPAATALSRGTRVAVHLQSARGVWDAYQRHREAVLKECAVVVKHTARWENSPPFAALRRAAVALAKLGAAVEVEQVIDRAQQEGFLGVFLLRAVLARMRVTGPEGLTFLQRLEARMHASGVAHSISSLTNVLTTYHRFGDEDLMTDRRALLLAMFRSQGMDLAAYHACILTAPSMHEAISLWQEVAAKSDIKDPEMRGLSACLGVAMRTLDASQLRALLATLKEGQAVTPATEHLKAGLEALQEEVSAAFSTEADIRERRSFTAYLMQAYLAAGDAAAALQLLGLTEEKVGVLPHAMYECGIRACGQLTEQARDTHFRKAEALFQEGQRCGCRRPHMYEALLEMYRSTRSVKSAQRLHAEMVDTVGGTPAAQELLAGTYRAAGFLERAAQMGHTGVVPGTEFMTEVQRQVCLQRFATSLIHEAYSQDPASGMGQNVGA